MLSATAGLVKLSIAGRDAADFLHRLCSAEIRSLSATEEPQAVAAAFLQPTGVVRAAGWIWRAGDLEFRFVTFAECAPDAAAFLDQYHFAESLEIQILSGEPHVWCIGRGQGPGQPTLPVGPSGEPTHLRLPSASGSSSAARRPELVSDAWLQQHGVVCWRSITEPAVGMAAVASNPLEVGWHAAASTRKGCYPGQEVVAKIDSLGHPARSLVRVRFSTDVSSPAEAAAATLVAPLPKRAGPNDGPQEVLALVRWVHRAAGTEVALRVPPTSTPSAEPVLEMRGTVVESYGAPEPPAPASVARPLIQ